MLHAAEIPTGKWGGSAAGARYNSQSRPDPTTHLHTLWYSPADKPLSALSLRNMSQTKTDAVYRLQSEFKLVKY